MGRYEVVVGRASENGRKRYGTLNAVRRNTSNGNPSRNPDPAGIQQPIKLLHPVSFWLAQPLTESYQTGISAGATFCLRFIHSALLIIKLR